MATRIYLPSSGSATISPSYDSSWEDTSIAARLKAVVSKISSTMTTVSFSEGTQTSNRDILFRQYISDPLAPQVISSQSVVFRIRASETNAGNNLFTTIVIKLVSNDGSIVRGTILASRRDNTEATTSLTNRNNTGNSTAVTCHAGDRLVIEVGMGGTPSAGNGHSSSMSIGDDNGTDLGANDTDTSAFNPYVEFANTLSFLTDGDITVGVIDSMNDGGSATYSKSVTVPTGYSNGAILCFTLQADNPIRSITSISYGGQSFSKLKGFNDGSFINLECWILENPPTGTNTWQVVQSAHPGGFGGASFIQLGNVLQSGQPDASNDGDDVGVTTGDIDITSIADRTYMFSQGVEAGGGTINSIGASQIPLTSQADVVTYSGVKSPAGLVTHTYSKGSSGTYVMIAITIKYYVNGSSIKTIVGLTKASAKTVNGLAIASVKTMNGLS